MCSGQNYEGCHRVCFQVRPQTGLNRKEKKIAESKNLGKAVGGEREVLAREPTVEKVVSDKKILLWQTLLEQNGYDDMEVVKFMKDGVPLVGTHYHPPCYPLKLKLAC